jgi:hypothetical protein
MMFRLRQNLSEFVIFLSHYPYSMAVSTRLAGSVQRLQAVDDTTFRQQYTPKNRDELGFISRHTLFSRSYACFLYIKKS